jgi:hypothetical protein
MSSPKLNIIKEKTPDSLRWEQAILDAEELLAEVVSLNHKRGLELAIKWFKIRLANGAPYPAPSP